VFVVQVGSAAYVPLAARLYLPALWLRDHADAVATLLPVEQRRGATKAEIALQLLDELRTECDTVPPLVVEDGYGAATEFRDGLAGRGLAVRDDQPAAVAEALQRFEWLRSALGVDHFEGRTWHGWHHHVSLVLVAYGFLCGEAPSGSFPLGRSGDPPANGTT
jgi:SRSO17 transposase